MVIFYNKSETEEKVVAGWWRYFSFINAMAAHASELEIAKKNLTDAIGDNVKQWVKMSLSLFHFYTFYFLMVCGGNPKSFSY